MGLSNLSQYNIFSGIILAQKQPEPSINYKRNVPFVIVALGNALSLLENSHNSLHRKTHKSQMSTVPLF